MHDYNIDLATLLKTLPGSVYWKDCEGRYLGCNEFMLTMAGYRTEKDMIGKTDHDMPWKDQAKNICTIDQQIIKTGVEHTLEETAELANGTVATYISSKKPLRNAQNEIIGIFGVSMEITKLKAQEETERKQKIEAENNHQLANVYLENILSNLPEPVFWLDESGRMLGCNDAEAKLFGYNQSSELIGKTIYDVATELRWNEQVAKSLRENDQKIMREKESQTFEEQDIAPDGTKRTFITHKAPLFDGNKRVIGIIATSVDITNRKLMEKELEEAKNAAEASGRAKSDFIANMSHDVKTPLAGIIGVTHLLSRKLEDPETLDMVQMMYNSGKQLMNFFENCLEMVKMETGEVALSNENFNPKAMVDEIADLFEPAAKNKNLKLYVHYDKHLPNEIFSSHAGLYRIMLNLLGNAIKFTAEGSVKVAVSCSKNPSDQKSYITLEVSDTGMGIPRDKLESIFDRFSRVTASYQGKFEGHGLGLYIVKKFVDTMGGEVSVESELRKGSCFKVTVPYLPPQPVQEKKRPKRFKAEAKPESTSTPQDAALASASKILIVEDSDIAQMAVKIILNTLGYEVEIVNSGAKALDVFEVGKYALIFMDIGLPDLTGDLITKNIRRLERGRGQHVPIIGVTAHVNDKELQSCLDAGMDEVIKKPLTLESAAMLLENYIEKADE